MKKYKYKFWDMKYKFWDSNRDMKYKSWDSNRHALYYTKAKRALVEKSHSCNIIVNDPIIVITRYYNLAYNKNVLVGQLNERI